ncbi:MAG TPA: STAS domain-containing protein [Ignavibacteria bacterium]|jgi:anti-anti-sigma factor
MPVKTTKLENDIVVLELRGRFVGGDETDLLKKTIQELQEQGNKKLVIDLEKVLYLNSTALGILVAAHTHYAKEGGQVKLCGITKNIENIFVITKLTLVFSVYENQLEAVASFSK